MSLHLRPPDLKSFVHISFSMSYSRESGDKGHTTKTRRAPNKLARVRVVRDGTRGDLAGRGGTG